MDRIYEFFRVLTCYETFSVLTQNVKCQGVNSKYKNFKCFDIQYDKFSMLTKIYKT